MKCPRVTSTGAKCRTTPEGARSPPNVQTRLKLSDVGLLEKVSESGEIKSTTRGEAKESYSLDKGAPLFLIGVDAIKAQLFNRLARGSALRANRLAAW